MKNTDTEIRLVVTVVAILIALQALHAMLIMSHVSRDGAFTREQCAEVRTK